MRISWLRFCLTVVLPIAFVSFTVDTSVQGGWTSFRNGSQNQGVAEGTLPNDLQLLWEFVTPDGVTSTPVIEDGQTFVGTLSGQIHCFELTTGNVVWTYNSLVTDNPKEFLPGFNAPLALNKRAIFGGDDFGTFHAVDRKTGQKLWSVETDGEIVGGAVLLGDNVIFGSHDGHLYSHNAVTGERVWAAETHGPVNGTPVIAGSLTFTTGCDQPVMRGVDVVKGEQAKEIPMDSLLIASCAVVAETLYFGSDNGNVVALNWTTGAVDWTYKPTRQQQIKSSPAVTDKYVVIGSGDKHLHCINRSDGTKAWTFETRARIDGSPVVAGERVYFGSADKTLYAVNLADGSEAWSHFVKQSISGSPAISDGYLVIGTDDNKGRVLCFGRK